MSVKQGMRFSAAAAASMMAMAGIGCSMGSFQATGGSLLTGTPASVAMQGGVHGGQQPIAGAKVQLYAVGLPATASTGGYGQGAVTMMSAPVASDINGSWNISNMYDCSTLADPSTPVYLVATGGNPTPANTGSIGAINNQYIALMASVGPCNAATSSMIVNINEVTTVAAVWAMQQFMAAPDGVHAASSYTGQGGATTGAGVNIGAPSGPAGGYGGVKSAEIGLRNATTMVDNLADYSVGVATARNTWATPWSDKINIIANILAACINSDPANSTTCADLMSAATPASANAPMDTIQAAYYMARNPTNNVQALTAFASAIAPFASKLTAPTDFAVVTGIAPYSSGTTYALNSSVAGAFDAYGRLWVANLNVGGGNAATVVELDANGKFLAGPFTTYTAAGGFQQATADSKNPLVGDPCPAGNTHSLYYSGTGPKSVAIDKNNVVWISNSEELQGAGCNASNFRTVMRILGSGPDGTGASVTTGFYSSGAPYALTVDANNNVWMAGSSNYISNYINGTASYASTTSAMGAIGSSPQSGATDMAGNVWFDSGKACVSTTNGILYQVAASTSAAPAITAGYYPSGATNCADGTVTTPVTNNTVTSIATDARNGIWEMSNKAGVNTVSYFLPSSPSWTKTSGSAVGNGGALTSAPSVGGINAPYAVAIDGSNRAWIGNNSGSILSALTASVDSTSNITGIQSAIPPSVVNSITYNGITFPNSSLPFQKGVKGTLIDPSGNVWLLNSNTSTAINWATVVVGAATPVVTPLVNQLQASLVGQQPQ